MKKFNFRLASVLKVRRHQEKLQQQAFAKVAKKKADLLEYELVVGQELESYHNDSMIGTTVDARHFRFLEEKHNTLFETKKKLFQIEKEVVKERRKMLEARQKTMALEKLEEKQRKLFLIEAERVEAATLNEMATQGHHRNQTKSSESFSHTLFEEP